MPVTFSVASSSHSTLSPTTHILPDHHHTSLGCPSDRQPNALRESEGGDAYTLPCNGSKYCMKESKDLKAALRDFWSSADGDGSGWICPLHTPNHCALELGHLSAFYDACTPHTPNHCVFELGHLSAFYDACISLSKASCSSGTGTAATAHQRALGRPGPTRRIPTLAVAATNGYDGDRTEAFPECTIDRSVSAANGWR